MAKFCTKCGKELKDGKCSSCDKKKETTTVVAKESAAFDISEYANKYLDMLKGMFKKPIETIKKYSSEEHFLLNIIALALNSIITGLFVYFILKEAMEELNGLLGFGLIGFGSVEVPFFKVFFNGFLYMASWFITAGAMIYVIANKIMKDKIDIKKAYCLVGTISTFTALTTLCSIVLVFISMKFALIVLLIAALFYLTYLFQGLMELTSIEKEKLAYLFVPVVVIAIFVMTYILPKVLS